MNNQVNISSPIFLKQVATGIALAAPLIAGIQLYVHDFSTDESYKCRYLSREECVALKNKESELRERMRQSTIAESKVTPEEEKRRRDNFRPAGWAD